MAPPEVPCAQDAGRAAVPTELGAVRLVERGGDGRGTKHGIQVAGHRKPYYTVGRERGLGVGVHRSFPVGRGWGPHPPVDGIALSLGRARSAG